MKILARLSIVAAIALSTCFLSTELHAQKKTVRRAKKVPINYLLRGSIALPNRIHAIPFIIGMSGGTVAGRFEARGGSNNDLFCYIVDSDGYINLKNGNQAQTFYNSGRVTVANIAVHLYPGKYYLVFHNDALFASKTVYGEIRYSGAGE